MGKQVKRIVLEPTDRVSIDGEDVEGHRAYSRRPAPEGGRCPRRLVTEDPFGVGALHGQETLGKLINLPIGEDGADPLRWRQSDGTREHAA